MYETFLLWSETQEYKERLKNTKSIIKSYINRYKSYVAFSGGKDSTVMLHLVLQENPDTLVIHWDYGKYYIPRDILREIISIARKCGAKNMRVLSSHQYNIMKREAMGVLGRCFIGVETPKLVKEGYKACFLGLRAEESSKRKSRLTSHSEYDKRGIYNVFPLKDWTWKDVWAYIVSNNLPYLSIYDKYNKLLGYDKARFVTFFDPEFDKFGSSNVDGVLMWKFKHIGGDV